MKSDFLFFFIKILTTSEKYVVVGVKIFNSYSFSQYEVGKAY